MNTRHLPRLLPDLLAGLLLVALPFLVLWQIWATNPADRVMFGGDILMGAYPTRVFVHRLLDGGAAPFWNPYQLGGMPLIGDIQVAPYYLPNLLLSGLYSGRDLPFVAFELLVITHYAIGGLFLYAFLRGLGVGPAAALVGAVGFEFNGFFIGHRGHYNMLAVAAWLPGVLWLLDRSWHATRPPSAIAWAVVAGLALSQLVMAGHPQAILYCAAAITGFAAYRWAAELRRPGRRGWVSRLRVPALFVLAGLLAAGVAAGALLPAAELLARSRRGDLSYTFVAQHSLMPRNLITLLIPEFLSWSGTEYRIYAGILTLVLAAAAWVVPEQARPERTFFTVAAVIALVVALGGFTALHGLEYRFLPGLSSVRVSARAFYIANLALCVLAAFGAESLMRTLSSGEQRRLRGLVRTLAGIFAGAVLLGAGVYALLVGSYRPVGEEFYFAESLFSREPSADAYTLLTQTANAYGLFLLLLAAALVLLWGRSAGRLHGRALALALVAITFIDLATFAPYHDTIRADPATARFTVRQYATTMLDAPWQITDQDQLIAALAALPDGVRIDNAAEVLPDNYSQVYRTAFATGYNVLDIQERFELLSQWPNLSDARRRDLLNVGYILTLPGATDPPEPGATVVLENSQGQLWRRAVQPDYARFSTTLRPAATSITLNGLLNLPPALGAQTTVAAEDGQLQETLRQLWPEAVDPALYAIGTTDVRSPVDIGVLAGGPIKYSAVIVDGMTVTPEQRGIIIALIDPASGAVLRAGGFDTYQSGAESDRLAALIDAAPAGTIVALATYDEGIASLNAAGRAAIASLGTTSDLTGQIGAAYAVIGVKGSPAGSALERIAQEPVTLDVGMGALPPQPEARVLSRMLSYQPDRISLLVQNDVRGLLSVSESLFPGWEAYVDGLPTPMLRADGLLRAVILPPALDGQPHEVTFVYRPLSARLGGAVSLAGLALAAGTLMALAVTEIPWPVRRLPSPQVGPGPAASAEG